MVGKTTLLFLLLHGTRGTHKNLQALLKDHEGKVLPFRLIEPLVEKNKEVFFNWVICSFNISHRSSVKENMFESTLVAQRRGLSRDGREFLS
jgi:hypothetical protein